MVRAARILTAAPELIKSKGGSFLIFLFNLNSLLVVIISTTLRPLVLYIAFEVSLVPLVVIIRGWGSQPERLQAVWALLAYTLIGSSPFTILFLLADTYGTSAIFATHHLIRGWEDTFTRRMLWYIIMGGFLVKVPIFGFHGWLTVAHVEAPIPASILLAGVILKLGAVGIIRTAATFSDLRANNLVLTCRVTGIIAIALTAITRIDLKLGVAYVSVAHIALILILLMLDSYSTLLGASVVLLSHSLTSSCIFLSAGTVNEVSGSRNLIINKGIFSHFSGLRWLFFFSTTIRIGAPPTVRLVAEIFSVSLTASWFESLRTVIFLGLILLSSVHFIWFNFSSKGHASLEHWDLTQAPTPIAKLVILYHIILCLISNFILSSVI